MARIVRTDRAKSDVLAIYQYIEQQNPSAAARWLQEVDRKLALIAGQPLIGEAVDYLERGVRRHTLGNYVLYYAPIAGGIEFRRVLHGARRIEDLQSLD